MQDCRDFSSPFKSTESYLSLSKAYFDSQLVKLGKMQVINKSLRAADSRKKKKKIVVASSVSWHSFKQIELEYLLSRAGFPLPCCARGRGNNFPAKLWLTSVRVSDSIILTEAGLQRRKKIASSDIGAFVCLFGRHNFSRFLIKRYFHYSANYSANRLARSRSKGVEGWEARAAVRRKQRPRPFPQLHPLRPIGTAGATLPRASIQAAVARSSFAARCSPCVRRHPSSTTWHIHSPSIQSGSTRQSMTMPRSSTCAT